MNGEVTVLTTDITSFDKVKRISYLSIKRAFDILISLLGLLILLPVALIVKIAFIITGDFHSIFYYQERIGKDGKTFKLFKFRSMVHNADELLEEYLKTKLEFKQEWDKNQKIEHDPRITKIGKILRKTSIDELPQFINVFLGDMSLIGPRPLVKGELLKHGGDPSIYESAKPGITGWWACNGRSATSYEKRLELEYYYINNCSILLDIKCIFKTIGAVISRTGVK